MVTLAQYESLPRYKKAITPYPEEYITMTEEERKKALNNSILKDNKTTLTAPQVFKSVQLKNNVNYRTPTTQEKNMLKINWINPDTAFLKTNPTSIKKPTTTKTPTTKRTTIIKAPAPKADTTQFGVAPEWWTQDEWNQSMAMYKADSENYYDTQRNKQVWDTWKTQDQVFGELFNQYATNPTSFNQAQQEQLLELSKKLWYAYWYKTWNPESDKIRNESYWNVNQTTDTNKQENNTAQQTNNMSTNTTHWYTLQDSDVYPWRVITNAQTWQWYVNRKDKDQYYAAQNPWSLNLYL